MTTKQGDDLDAVRAIVEALKPFDAKEQVRILRWAREKVGLEPTEAPSPPPPHSPAATPPPAPGAAHGRPKDIKTFAESKGPKSDNQFAAVVAYFYQFEAPEAERKPSITADDLVDATRKAGWERIRKPGQTLINAHTRGYFDKAERGSYKLSSVGENLVAMALPPGSASAKGRVRKTTKGKKKS